MIYFKHKEDVHSSQYFEFRSDTSLYLYEDQDCIKPFVHYLKQYISFDYYGITIITKEDWNVLITHKGETTSVVQELLEEVTPWVNDSFIHHDYFKIIGI